MNTEANRRPLTGKQESNRRPLTDKAIKALKPRQKPYKRADERGLFLIVRPDGALWWRFKYRYGGREKLLSMGTYPDTSLKLARDKRDAARRELAAGLDPSEMRKAEKATQTDTFEVIARDWLKLNGDKRTTGTLATMRRRLETFIFPYIGNKPIAAIEAPELLTALRRIEGRGSNETAHRTRSACSRIFRYAIAIGKAERDPAADLKGALAPVKVRNMPALTAPRKVGELLRALEGYEGQPTVVAALKLLPLVFVRPGELRGAEWAEFRLTGKEPEWRIAAERMKMREQHLVPLSRQAVAILRGLHALTGKGRLVFPSLRSAERPISDNTLNAALRRLGFDKDTHTAHGFRSTASSLLNEMGFAPDIIELQLAHAERNKVRAAYNRAERLKERREMMQAWADYLDKLKASKPA